MTIKQNGGVFGRNPSFNDVDVETLDVSGTINAEKLIVDTNTLYVDPVNNFVGVRTAAPADSLTVNGNLYFGGTSRTIYNVGAADLRLQTGTGDTVIYRDNAATTVATFNDSGLAFPSGKGIDFSATAGTGTSELFDDYEEGVYVATLTPATSGTITITTTGNELAYTKIGRLVYINGMIIIDSVSSPVGASVELNLPFASSNLGDAAGRAAGTSVQNTTGSYAVTPIYLFESDSGADILFDASTVVAGHRFYISLTYITG